MEKIVKLFLTVVLIVFAQYQVQAQVDLDRFNDPAYKQILTTRAKELVMQMNDYITNMVDRRESSSNRWNYRKAALNLFIGHGEPYKDINNQWNTVKMETVTVKVDGRKVYNTRLMKVYFSRLINLIEGGTYTEVSITSTDIHEMKASTLKKINDTLYMCTVSFGQWYDAKKGEIYNYDDFTEKHVTVYFVPAPTPTRTEFIPMLGDIKAGEAYRTDGRY